MKSYAVSIIVPVYNVEKYIAKCATTLFEQDFDSIEYIFVNDCTPDNSMQILQSVIEKYPNRKDDIKIINNEKNSGSSITRKTGLDNANGEYVIFADSDDWIEPDMISSLYKKAKEDGVDIVVCDFFLNFTDKEAYKRERYEEIAPGDEFKAMLSGFVLPALYNKLQKKSAYENIKFPNFSFSEDIAIMVQLYYNTKKISYIPKAFYHYNKTNESSLSTKIKQKTIDEMKEMYLFISNFLKQKNIYDENITNHRIRLISVVLFNANSDYISILKNIDEKIANIKFVWLNKKFSLLQKLVCSLPFFRIEWLFTLLKNIYKG